MNRGDVLLLTVVAAKQLGLTVFQIIHQTKHLGSFRPRVVSAQRRFAKTIEICILCISLAEIY